MKMLRDDLLLTDDPETHRRSLLYIPSPTKQNDKVLLYRVEAIGDEVVDVKVGDVIGLRWADTVPPFLVDNIRYTLTSEKKVIFILYDN